MGGTYEPKPYPIFSMSIRQPLSEGVCMIPFHRPSTLKTNDDRVLQARIKKCGEHLEMNFSMKNMGHVLFALFISVFLWNTPKAIINQSNSHENESGLVSLT